MPTTRFGPSFNSFSWSARFVWLGGVPSAIWMRLGFGAAAWALVWNPALEVWSGRDENKFSIDDFVDNVTSELLSTRSGRTGVCFLRSLPASSLNELAFDRASKPTRSAPCESTREGNRAFSFASTTLSDAENEVLPPRTRRGPLTPDDDFTPLCTSDDECCSTRCTDGALRLAVEESYASDLLLFSFLTPLRAPTSDALVLQSLTLERSLSNSLARGRSSRTFRCVEASRDSSKLSPSVWLATHHNVRTTSDGRSLHEAPRTGNTRWNAQKHFLDCARTSASASCRMAGRIARNRSKCLQRVL